MAWRVWGRKKAAGAGDDDDLIQSPGVSSHAEKSTVSGGAAGGDVFKNTLDQYHNPTGKMNPSANF